jgi:hypothetical protein
MRNPPRDPPELSPLERCWHRLPRFFVHQVTIDQAGMQEWAKEARAFPELQEMARIVAAFVEAVEPTNDAVAGSVAKSSKVVDLASRRPLRPRRR